MPQFKLTPAGFAAVKKRIFIRFIVIFVIALPLVLLVGHNGQEVDAGTNMVANLITVLFVVTIFFFSIRRSLKYVKQLYLSYTLVIEGNVISRYQQNTPVVSFYFKEVSSISKSAKGDFTIKGTKPGDIIFVSHNVENVGELEQVLTNIQPIEVKNTVPFVQKYNLLLTALVLIMMVSVYTVSNKFIVGFCGTVVSGVLAWGLYDIQKNKNLDTKTRRNSLWTIVVLISVITVTIIKLRL